MNEIKYRKLEKEDIPKFIEMRLVQLQEEGAEPAFDLTPALYQYYEKYFAEGTFVAWIAIDEMGIIAKRLLSKVVQEAKEYGCGAVQITASDIGVRLYTDFGFEKNNNFMQYKID